MLFENININHIQEAVKVYEKKGAPEGLGSSAFYDVIINGKTYPPKPIIAYANELASGTAPGNYFNGGANTPAFKALERLGLIIQKKTASNTNHLPAQSIRVWIYSPGKRASKWDEFYAAGIMALGWDELKDLKRYHNREEIKSALVKLNHKEVDYKNDVSANDDFANKVQIGDLVIVKKGRKELLGYGLVESEYYFNNESSSFKSQRKVDWKIKGNWKVDHDLVLKTLTDISDYKEEQSRYTFYYERLLDFMGVSLTGINHQKAFTKWLIEKYGNDSGTANSYIKSIQLLSKILDEKLFTIDDQNILENLYRDLVQNQRDKNGKFFLTEAPSYGLNGFYSAAIKAYLEFLLQYQESSSKKSMVISQNLILYGPPGTGKTYKLKNEFFPQYSVKETSLSADEYFTEIVQDLSWFQVIALALLEEGRSKVQNIIENRWVISKDALSASKNVRATIWGSLQTHTVRDCEFVKYKTRTEPLLFNKDQNSYWQILEESIEEQAPELIKVKAQVDNFQANPNQEIKRYIFTTFHQAFSYEDFIEGIKPIMDQDEGGELSYRIEDGVFKKICKRALNDPQNRYAIFIDEINRGNIANIFGELITLIELDKRKGMPNEMSVTLPYSKQPFSVPSNLDIIGTMNTADRSVEALDTALRRRFNFVEMLPETNLIDVVLDEDAVFEGIKISEILKIINLRIEKLIDRDHSIGHAYFLKLKGQKDQKNALIEIFCDNIIPLLQEYFYNDYPKIGLVLGSGFIKQIEQEVRFADFEADNSDDYLERPLYHLVSKKELEKDNALVSALNTLLAKKDA